MTYKEPEPHNYVWHKAIAKVLEHEGGYVDHPSDPGGATNYGISLRWLRGEGLDIDGDGDIDADDVRGLTLEHAQMLYHQKFWLPMGLSRFDDDLAVKYFDMAVNMGPAQATKLVQRSLRAVGYRIVDDGKLGPQTFSAIRVSDSDQLIVAMRVHQDHFYRGLVQQKPKFEPFLNGWLKRAYSC